MEVNERMSKHMKVGGSIWKLVEVDGSRWKSMEAYYTSV